MRSAVHELYRTVKRKITIQRHFVWFVWFKNAYLTGSVRFIYVYYSLTVTHNYNVNLLDNNALWQNTKNRMSKSIILFLNYLSRSRIARTGLIWRLIAIRFCMSREPKSKVEYSLNCETSDWTLCSYSEPVAFPPTISDRWKVNKWNLIRVKD